jgi:hypothetical protein
MAARTKKETTMSRRNRRNTTSPIPLSFNARILGVRKACSEFSGHYAITGVSLTVTPATVTAVATDGHQLVEVSVPNERDAPSLSAVLPKPLLNLLTGKNPVQLCLTDGKLSVTRTDGISVSCPLMQGTFPQYEKPEGCIFWPESDAMVTLQFYPRIMRKMCDAIIAAAPNAEFLKIRIHKDAATKPKPLIITGGNGYDGNIRAAIMPASNP